MKILDLEQNTPEWLEWRKSHIGASDMCAVMGVSKWTTPYQLWQQKLGFVDSKTNRGMQYGHDMEDDVRAMVNERLDADFTPLVCVHDDHPHFSASLDGFDESRNEICEIKCANFKDHSCAMAQKVPDHYWPQIQWQLLVSGCAGCWYTSYHKGEIECFFVEPDKEYHDILVEKGKEFLSFVHNMEEPPFTESDYVPIEDEEFDELAHKYADIRRLSDEYSKQEKELRDALLTFTDDGNCEGCGIRFTRVNREGSVDWKKLYLDACEHFPDLLDWKDPETYRKKSIGFWKVSLVD